MSRFIASLVISFVFFLNAKASDRRYSQIPFQLGPVRPTVDLRNMVRNHIVRHTCDYLDQAEQRRLQAFSEGQWQAWRDLVCSNARQPMGDMPTGKEAAPLHARLISRHEFKLFDVENVLFESFPGWEVNASVFLPKKNCFPPPWQAIVVPVGHSAKIRANYQIPAQVFAALGYVAVIFDPPGMAGEKQSGNDHFIDGVRCYLTGTSANRYFVMDAIRCMDYLETRSDINSRHGFGMTGVSGGGTTTILAALLDDRIAAVGPACCALPSAQHPILDVYAPCAETLPYAWFKNGMDDIDLLCAAIPTPLLLMYGEKDEVFKLEYSREIDTAVASAFAAAGKPANFSSFADTCGHAYSIAMALKFGEWMDKWVRHTSRRQHPVIDPAQFSMLSDTLLYCHPNLDGNIYSLNRRLAVELKKNRKTIPVEQAVQQTIGMHVPVQRPGCTSGVPAQVWAHYLQELLLIPEDGLELPATFLYPVYSERKKGAVLFFDDRGRWTELRQQKLLPELAHFLQMDQEQASVLTVDLDGWGDTAPADMPYEIAAWGHSSRWISYVSAAMGDHILAMRIRHGAAALAYLRSRTEIDPDRIVVAGYGMGGVVAQHLAYLDEKLAGFFSINSLATFESLALSKKYSWSPEAFLPNVLKHYDLPELLADLAMPALLVNPLDAEQHPLTDTAMQEIFSDAKTANDRFVLTRTDHILQVLEPWVKKLVY